MAMPLLARLAHVRAELVCAAELTGGPSLLTVTALQDLHRDLTAVFALPEKPRVLEWFGEGRRIVAETLVSTQILATNRASAIHGPFGVAVLAAQLALEAAKDRSELAASWTELELHVMVALNTEVEVCSREVAALNRTPLAFSVPSDVTLEQLLLLGSPDKSLAAPALSAAEREFYTLLDRLRARLVPLRVLMELLKVRVEDFRRKAERIFPSSATELALRHATLSARYEKDLLLRYTAIEYRSVTVRWQETCAFVVTEVMRRCDNMISAFESTGSSDAIAASFKTCAAGVGLVQAAVAARVVHAPDLADEFNTMLLPRWRQLNSLLGSSSMANSSASSASVPSTAIISLSPMKGLRQFKVIKNGNSSHSPTPNFLPGPNMPFASTVGSPIDRFAPGLDLGVDVNPPPSVPFSVQVDRVIDLSIDAGLERGSKDVRAALLDASRESDNFPVSKHSSDVNSSLQERIIYKKGLQSHVDYEESDLDEVVSLDHVKNEVPVDKSFCGNKSTEDINLFPPSDSNQNERMLHLVSLETEYRSSKIPLISSNYAQLGLPVIKKKNFSGYKPTLIPSISPLHPVFISPERRPAHFTSLEEKSFKTPNAHKFSEDKLRSPVTFDISRFDKGHRRFSSASSSGTDDLLIIRSRSSSLQVSADMMTLLVLRTPDLTCGTSSTEKSLKRITLRSSSPERPETSIGSRYDTVNLTRPLKTPKKAWR